MVQLIMRLQQVWLAGSGMGLLSSGSAWSASASASTSASASASGSTSLSLQPSQTSSRYVESTVPTGTAVSGNYSGEYRPQIHFSPPKGFMNDPNGLHLDNNGTWHMYYQYNPTGVTPGNQHWGHATSPNLYHWTNQPIAIFPPDNNTQVFSGSAVIDKDNTSGFFPDQEDGVVAIYTLNTPDKQVQAIAYSTDGGYTFTPYEGNPVIDSTTNAFRDPKVVWYEDHWVMVLAYAAEYEIGIYTSNDLKYWTPSSNVSHVGFLGLQYECPNLVPLPLWSNGSTTGEQIWTLFISVSPNAPQGGSTIQYIPGSFDGYTFTPFDGASRFTEFTKDSYAGQFFYNTPDDQAVSIYWASNTQYTAKVPTAEEGWRSTMSLPRRNYMTYIDDQGWDLISRPYDLTPVKGGQLSYDEDFNNKSVIVDYSNSTVGAIYFTANFSVPDGAVFGPSASINFSFSPPGSDEQVRGGYFFGGDNPRTTWLDRGQTKGYGPNDPLFTDRFIATGPRIASSIWGVVDRTILEIFVDDGAQSSTMLFYPEQPFSNFSISTDGLPEGMGVTLGVWELSSVWDKK